MLRARIATAVVALPVLFYVIFWGPLYLFQVIVLGFTGLALMEFFSMAFPADSWARWRGICTGAIVACSIGLFLEVRYDLLAAASVIALLVALLASIFSPDEPKKSFLDVGVTIVGVLYAGALLPHLIWLRVMADGFGSGWVLFVLAVAMAGDTAGYFIGRFFGRTPLAPRISPKKTLEGTAGAIGGNLLAGSLVKAFLLPEVSWVEILLISVFAGGFAQLGDLCESLMKRAFGAKDSGWILPGHGGVLDRTDSLVFPTVLVYYYLNIF